MNAPNRKDSVIVPEGTPKLTATVDGKMPNATTFKFHREDHTLGQLLRMELLRDPSVRYAGYKHAHPLDNDIYVKVQAAAGVTPTVVLSNALKRLETEVTELQSQYRGQLAVARARDQAFG